jgi:hypothetical protein
VAVDVDPVEQRGGGARADDTVLQRPLPRDAEEPLDIEKAMSVAYGKRWLPLGGTADQRVCEQATTDAVELTEEPDADSGKPRATAALDWSVRAARVYGASPVTIPRQLLASAGATRWPIRGTGQYPAFLQMQRQSLGQIRLRSRIAQVEFSSHVAEEFEN